MPLDPETPPPMPRRSSADAGKQKLVAKEEQLAQAAGMLAKRLFEGKTVNELAEEYGIARETVSRRLRLVRKQGVPEEARTIFIKEMLPAAMAAVMDALQSPDGKLRMQAAKMVIEGLEAMKLPEEEREARKAGAGDDDTYEIWREKIRVTRGAGRSDGQAAAEGVIDTTAVETAASQRDATADRALPAALPFRAGVESGS